MSRNNPEWIADLETCTVKHKSGLTILFRKEDEGSWAGELLSVPDNLTLDTMELTRLMREGADAHLEALRRRH